MKEGYPQKEPILYRLRGLTFHLGCNPDSMRFLRRAEDGKFFVILEAEKKDGVPKIIKVTGPGINVGRLRNESRVLSLLPRGDLERNGILIPKLEQELTPYEGLHAIMISKMPEGQSPSFKDYCHVLRVFRKIKIPKELKMTRIEPEDYRRKTLKRLNALRRIGALKGFYNWEIERIQDFYQGNWESLEPYDMVFVHGDFKEKHVRRIDDGLIGVHDFDKSVIGCELEDPAWLSVRHFTLESEIKDHLKTRFVLQGEKLRNFDTAFRLMQIDRLVEAYYTRTFQWRGNLDPFSYISKGIGRLGLLLKT